jgi:hypothetical protein
MQLLQRSGGDKVVVRYRCQAPVGIHNIASSVLTSRLDPVLFNANTLVGLESM